MNDHSNPEAQKPNEIEKLKAEHAATLLLTACEPFLKDGETPAECIARNRSDTDMVLSLLAQARAQLAAVQQAHSELASIAGSAMVLATLDTVAGERPVAEPDHALTEAVWRLVRERDAAYAGLQTARACIMALTPGHRTGYDWNADPLYLTRMVGEALSAIDACLTLGKPLTLKEPK